MDTLEDYLTVFNSVIGKQKLGRKRRLLLEANIKRRLEMYKQGKPMVGRWPRWLNIAVGRTIIPVAEEPVKLEDYTEYPCQCIDCENIPLDACRLVYLDLSKPIENIHEFEYNTNHNNQCKHYWNRLRYLEKRTEKI